MLIATVSRPEPPEKEQLPVNADCPRLEKESIVVSCLLSPCSDIRCQVIFIILFIDFRYHGVVTVGYVSNLEITRK